MQQQASNPIYDAVFKYLMEDEHIARTILSALLKEKVVRVKDRRDEKINKQFDSITVFRMDFAATIEKDNGEEDTVLVELQKNWVPTETLRCIPILTTSLVTAAVDTHCPWWPSTSWDTVWETYRNRSSTLTIR